jgi:endonuclease/exonuclease/phosphatase family metal-dependent hydrolase
MYDEKEVRMSSSENTEIHGDYHYIVISIAFLFFFEFTRELLGTIYNLNLATMSLNASLIAILAFFSPVLFLFKLNTVQFRNLATLSGFIFAGCRVLLSVDPPLYIYLLLAFMGIASFGIFLCAFISLPGKESSHLSKIPMNTIIIYAAITGAGGDLFFRTLGNTFDVTIYGFTAYRPSSLLFVVPLTAVFCAALVIWYSNHSSPGVYPHPAQKVKKTSTLVIQGMAVGAVGFLFLTILAYPNTLSRWIDGSYTLSVILHAGAFGGVFLISALPQGKKVIYSGYSSIIGVLVLFLTIILLTYTSLSLITSIFSALSLFLIPMIVLFHLRTLNVPYLTMRKRAVFFTIAAATLVVLMVLSVFTLTYSYVPGMSILRDQIGMILLIAALIAIITTIPVMRSSMQPMPPSPSALSSYLLVLIGIVMIIGPSLGTGLFPEPHPLPPTDESLRIMTYNIHQGYNTEGKINPWDILEPITGVDPHIIALQESDLNRITSTNVDIVRWLAHKRDMYSYFGPRTNHQIYGVALLSTFPLTNTEVYFLRSIEDQRVMIRGDIEYNGSTLSIYAVHMGLSEEDRTNQTAQILDILSENPRDSILLGDFNSTPDSPQMNHFFAYYSDAWIASGHPADDPSGYTFSSLFPEKHIDYILIPKEWEHRVTCCVILSDIYASDHLPVWAEII